MTDPRTQLSSRDITQFRDLALALAEESRRMLRGYVAAGFEVKRKPDGSFVTSADLAVETRLPAMVQETFPAHGVVGEELPRHLLGADLQWVFDPIDGTEEFVRRLPTFGTIIALFYRDIPVVGVIDVPLLDARGHAGFGLGAFQGGTRLKLDDCDSGTPGQTLRIGLSARTNFMRHRDHNAAFDRVTRAFPNHTIFRSCYTHLCAATGQSDAVLDVGNPIWDIAAARILVEEAGGAFRVLETYEHGTERIFTTAFGRPAVVMRLAEAFAGAAARPA